MPTPKANAKANTGTHTDADTNSTTTETKTDTDQEIDTDTDTLALTAPTRRNDPRRRAYVERARNERRRQRQPFGHPLWLQGWDKFDAYTLCSKTTVWTEFLAGKVLGHTKRVPADGPIGMGILRYTHSHEMDCLSAQLPGLRSTAAPAPNRSGPRAESTAC